MKIRYFAWMREHTGCAEEHIDLPQDIKTVSGLVDYLKNKSDGHAKALSNMNVVRVAVNQDYCDLDKGVSNHDEVAFFPPVTGG